jgi:hypothetical protein
MAEEVEPLEPGLWFRRIEMIAKGELGSIENSLRHAAHLAQLAPRPLRGHVGLAIDEDEFEVLLNSGAFDSAARRLRPVALSTEAATEGAPSRALIKCSLSKRPFNGSGRTIADAILDAWTSWLLAHRTGLRAD